MQNPKKILILGNVYLLFFYYPLDLIVQIKIFVITLLIVSDKILFRINSESNHSEIVIRSNSTQSESMRNKCTSNCLGLNRIQIPVEIFVRKNILI